MVATSQFQFGFLVVLLCGSAVFCAPKTWPEAIDEGFAGVQEYATKKNVNKEFAVPKSSPRLLTFPLHHAIRQTNNGEIVKLLLDNGAKPNKVDSMGDTAIMRGLEANNLIIVSMLLDAGAKASHQNNNGESPLTKALYTGNYAIIKKILAEDVNLDFKDNTGRTITHLAATQGNVQAVKAFVKAGAEPGNEPDIGGETALSVAAYNGFASIVKFLLANGADADQLADKSGNTPLHKAARRGFHGVVKMLVAAGADKEPFNNDGQTISDVACKEPQKITKEDCEKRIAQAMKTKVKKIKDVCDCTCDDKEEETAKPKSARKVVKEKKKSSKGSKKIKGN
ncbi:hypothetical protein BSKO_11715 [Bryopsis sp. KO-2023]|nr:hypothetical protein BSKO_11715 [Bryopsis sp. KO-2023]